MFQSKEAKLALTIAIACNLCSGVQYCWSLFGKSMIAEYGWTVTQSTLPYTTLTVVTVLWSFIAGRFTDFWKPKHGIMLGGASMGLGLIIAGATSSFWGIMIAIGGLVGIASTSISSNTSPTAVKFFPSKYRGRVSGLCTMGLGLSSLYMAPIINGLQGNFGTKNTFFIVGGAAIILICGLGFLMPTPKRDDTAEDLTYDDSDSIYNNTITPKEAPKHYETWVCFGLYFGAQLLSNIMSSQVTTIASAQAGWENGFILVSAMAIGNAVGRIGFSSLSDKIGVMNTWKIVYGMGAINMFLFVFYRTPVTMFIGTVILGLEVGASVALMYGGTISCIFGRKYMGSIIAYALLAFGVSSILGSTLSAQLYEMTNSYTGTFIACGVVQVICFLLPFTIKEGVSKVAK